MLMQVPRLGQHVPIRGSFHHARNRWVLAPELVLAPAGHGPQKRDRVYRHAFRRYDTIIYSKVLLQQQRTVLHLVDLVREYRLMPQYSKHGPSLPIVGILLLILVDTTQPCCDLRSLFVWRHSTLLGILHVAY